MSGRARRSFWPKQLALDTTVRTNCESAGKTPAASSRRKKLRNDDGVLLFIARRRACGVDSTRANSPRRYGRVTEQKGKNGNDDGVLLFIARRRACGVDSTRANSPRRYGRVTARESGEIRSAATSAWRRRQAERWSLIFEIFTELPLRPFFKLLTNFLKKLKISKNESCSIFQTLQLCF